MTQSRPTLTTSEQAELSMEAASAQQSQLSSQGAMVEEVNFNQVVRSTTPHDASLTSAPTSELANSDNEELASLSEEQAEIEALVSKVLEIANSNFDYSLLKADAVHSCRQMTPTSVEFSNFRDECELRFYRDLHPQAKELMEQRFSGYYPIAVDLETSGIEPAENGIWQIGAVALSYNQQGKLVPYAECKVNVLPVDGDKISAQSVRITKINPFDYRRKAIPIEVALSTLCSFARRAQKAHGCKRCLIIGHNVSFDEEFLNYNFAKHNTKRVPFHPFCTLDTTPLAAVFAGNTRLQSACSILGIPMDSHQAHDALYDARQAALLFAHCANQLPHMNYGVVQPIPDCNE